MALKDHCHIIELDVDNLSIEAMDWLENSTQDLCWVKRKYQQWIEYLTIDEIAKIKNPTVHMIAYHYQKKEPGDQFVWHRSIDAVFFASISDATYFKMKYL